MLSYLVNKLPVNAFFKWHYPFVAQQNMGIIIALHRITPNDTSAEGFNSFIEMSKAHLIELIERLTQLGVQFVSLGQLEAILKSGTPPAKPIVHFSFDDGYVDNFELAFPVFKAFNIPFSIFITAGFIEQKKPLIWWYLLQQVIENKLAFNATAAGLHISQEEYKDSNHQKLFNACCDACLTLDNNQLLQLCDTLYAALHNANLSVATKMLSWLQIKDMANSGLCDIGVHTVDHRRFCNLNAEQQLQQIVQCREIIEEHTGIQSRYFAYPFGAVKDIKGAHNLQLVTEQAGMALCLTTIPGQLNSISELHKLPRVFFNNNFNEFTIKSRLNGTYQKAKAREDSLG